MSTDKCIVLDLDNTLLCTADEDRGLKDLFNLKILSDPTLMHLRKRCYHLKLDGLDIPGSTMRTEMWGIKRPHVDEFLKFCFSYFKIVAVYSAGDRQYVENIVDIIFKDLPKPHIIFSRDECKIFKENGSTITVKPLIRMMTANKLMTENMFFTNTLAIDDLNTTYRENPGNGVLIPKYEPYPNIRELERDDKNLLKLMNWLKLPEVSQSVDVRLLDKSQIFN